MIALDLLAQAALMAVVALGAWTAMGEGMVLHWWTKLVEGHVHPFLAKPLATCSRCMCSVCGIAALAVCGLDPGFTWNAGPAIDWPRVAQLPVLILAAVGIQEMLHKP